MMPSLVGLATQGLLAREDAIAAELDGVRMQVLHLQLQPYWMAEALQTADALLATDVRAARALLGGLGGLLRASLERIHVQEAPLRDELALLGNYVEVARARFRDRLIVQTNVASDAMDAHVPTALLQPLVEHAIQRSVARTAEPATIQVSASREGDELHLGVNGSGSLVRLVLPFRVVAAA
jgi:two-component system, LytTR family, sensor kinase